MRREDAETLFEAQRASYAGLGSGLRPSWPESEALDAEGFSDLLGRRRYAVLATARADGRAHASPVAFVVADRAFWFALVRGVRLTNLRARPWASVVVMEGEADEGEAGERHRAVTVEGPVRLYEGEAFASARGRLDSLWVERHGHPPDWAFAIIELRPKRVFSHAAPE